MNEEYRRYNERIEVSNLGNVKIKGEIIKPCSCYNYDIVTDKGKTLRIHNMVGELFQDICGKKIKWGHLHHINHNQKDNRAENLVWLSRSEHKRLHQAEDGVSVGVKAYNKEGKKIGEWDSKLQASKETGISYCHITDIILEKEGRFTAGGYYWFKKDEPEEKIFQKILNIQNTKYQSLKGKKGKKVKKNLG